MKYKTYKISEEIRQIIERDARWNYFSYGVATGVAFSLAFTWLMLSWI